MIQIWTINAVTGTTGLNTIENDVTIKLICEIFSLRKHSVPSCLVVV